MEIHAGVTCFLRKDGTLADLKLVWRTW